MVIRKYLPKNVEELIHWYEKWVSPVALVVGFLLDNYVLLNRVDVLFGNILLLSYLVGSAACIVALNAIESGRMRGGFALWIAPFLPVILQLFFGALFSGYLSLYSRSAGIAVSWLFVFVLAFLLVGNERFRARYQRLPFQISILFLSLYSFLIFFLPLIFKAIGPVMFLLAGGLSVVIIALVLGLLRALAYDRLVESRRATYRSLAGIFIAFNVLYFSNLIPPLPLALKESGVYHAIVREESAYSLTGEHKPWTVRYLSLPATVHITEGSSAYVYTAVFAPSGLSTVLRHEWQFYDTKLDRWVTKSDVKFAIHGGRDGGFRGYSQKFDPEPGSWRVNVLTEHGQIVGRVRFDVIRTDAQPELIEVTK